MHAMLGALDRALCPCCSSKPFSSVIVVSSVQALPSFSRRWPWPRATAVSKVNQPSSAAVCLGCLALELPVRAACRQDSLLEHVADRVAALGGLDVPGEGDEIAPVAVIAGTAPRRHRHRRVRARSQTAPAILKAAASASIHPLLFSRTLPGASAPAAPRDLSRRQICKPFKKRGSQENRAIMDRRAKARRPTKGAEQALIRGFDLQDRAVDTHNLDLAAGRHVRTRGAPDAVIDLDGAAAVDDGRFHGEAAA